MSMQTLPHELLRVIFSRLYLEIRDLSACRRVSKLVRAHTPPVELIGPLFAAIVANDVKQVSDLLDRGAPLWGEDKKGRQPLHIASLNGRTKIVELLLDHGADQTVKAPKSLKLPLHFAASENREDVVRLLVERGGKPLLNELESKGATPLCYLCFRRSDRCSLDFIKFLCENGAKPVFGPISDSSAPPLFNALFSGWASCARLLLKYATRAELENSFINGDSGQSLDEFLREVENASDRDPNDSD